MFALLIPGRLVQPVTQVPDSPERFAAHIEQADQLNHVAVFLTGQAPFPDGYGCTIHLEVPGKGWQLIGSLTNAKPSAIFRLRNTFIPSSTAFSSTFNASASASSSTATLGILCEPLQSVEAQTAALSQNAAATAANPSNSTALVPARGAGPDPVLLAQMVGKNLYNALAGFVQPLPDGSGSWIDFSLVTKWYSNFERKLKSTGVGFLLQQD